MKTYSLEELKTLLRAETEKKSLSCVGIPCGIPQGGITQVSGPGKTELVLKFLEQHPELRIAWIEEAFSVFPFAFLQRKIGLDRVLFVDARDQTLWATLQVLKSQCFPVVLLYAESMDIKDIRRVQLAAERSHAAVLWLSPSGLAAWAVSLQIQLKDQMDPVIVRQKFG